MEPKELTELLENIQKWTDYMFLNDPLANCIRSYCHTYKIPDLQMYQMICVALIKQKVDRMIEEFKEAQVRNFHKG